MKVDLLSDGAGKLTPMIYCEGCECAHLFDSRWKYNGDPEKPTFTPSMLVNYPDGKVCHSFVTAGRIRYLGDSTHQYANQVRDLPDWETL